MPLRMSTVSNLFNHTQLVSNPFRHLPPQKVSLQFLPVRETLPRSPTVCAFPRGEQFRLQLPVVLFLLSHLCRFLCFPICSDALHTWRSRTAHWQCESFPINKDAARWTERGRGRERERERQRRGLCKWMSAVISTVGERRTLWM